MFSDVVLDLETMGTSSTSAIISIGAVVVDLEYGEIGDAFYETIDLQSCLDVGLTVDGDTVLWWMRQSTEARDAILCSSQRDLADALHEFSEFLHVACDNNLGGVWGNGVRFDNEILLNAYRVCKLDPPWTFKQDRCYRTARALFPDVKVPFEGAAHHALDDAKHEARMLIAIHEKIKVARNL